MLRNHARTFVAEPPASILPPNLFRPQQLERCSRRAQLLAPSVLLLSKEAKKFLSIPTPPPLQELSADWDYTHHSAASVSAAHCSYTPPPPERARSSLRWRERQPTVTCKATHLGNAEAALGPHSPVGEELLLHRMNPKSPNKVFLQKS